MKLFSDLDGTLLDVSQRHYAVYCDVTRMYNGTAMPKGDYWQLKRRKTGWKRLLELSGLAGVDQEEYLSHFIERIESDSYLNMDTLYPDVLETLRRVGTMADCFLVTLRRNETQLLHELELLGLLPLFEEVLTGHSESDGYDVKVALIGDRLQGDVGVIVGDTEADIVTGQMLGLKTIAVNSGIRDESFLSALRPDAQIDKFADILSVLD